MRFLVYIAIQGLTTPLTTITVAVMETKLTATHYVRVDYEVYDAIRREIRPLESFNDALRRLIGLDK